MTSDAARLRPGLAVFALDRTKVQIGLVKPVVLDGLTEEEAAFVASLEGPQPGPSSPTAPLAHVMRRLDSQGLLGGSATNDAHESALPDRHVRVSVIGADALGTAIGMCLVQAGIDRVVFDDLTPLHASLPSLSGCQTRAQAAAHAVNHWPAQIGTATSEPTGNASVDVAIAVAHGGVSATVVHDLMVADQPHLPVIGDEEGITVGPLVVPGSGPCLNCLGIERASHDPHWPLVALQCNGSRAIHAPASLRSIAAGVACDVVMEFIAGRRHEPSQWRIDHTGAGPRVTKRQVCAHPSCGCVEPLVVGDNLQNLQSILL